MVAAYKELNTAELANKTRAVDEVGRDFVVAGREVFGRHGAGGLYGVIDAAYPDFRKALTNIARASADQNMAPELVVANPPPELIDDIAWAGAFVLLARHMGLMSATGGIPERLEPMVELFFRYRWINSVRGAAVPQELLSPTEFATLNLWRLHEGKNIDESRRHKYVAGLALAVRDYPAEAADGVVYYQHGKLNTARALFQKAMADKSMAPLMERYIVILDDALSAAAKNAPKPDAGTTSSDAAKPGPDAAQPAAPQQ
jgi:hypothetical protein